MLLLALAITFSDSLGPARASATYRSSGQRQELNVLYRVPGHTATASVKDDDVYGELTAESQVGLVEVPGEPFPVVRVVLEQCGRDCSYNPLFFRLDARSWKLTRLPLYQIGDVLPDMKQRPSRCFSIPQASTELYMWDLDSAIPIRDKKHVRYFALRLPNGTLGTVEQDEVYALGSEARPGATPAPMVPLSKNRWRVYDDRTLVRCN